MTIPIQSVWSNTGAKEISVNIYRSDENLEEIFVLNESNNWMHWTKNLPRYDENSKEYNYFA